jgi:hypothetical protein
MAKKSTTVETAIQNKSITYGDTATSEEIMKFLLDIIEINRQAEEAGRPRQTACIWGEAGTGKTDLVKSLASLGYRIIHVPIAQFEEMGDFNGYPVPDSVTGVTKFLPPFWVPTKEEKCILFFDDFNRADIRILKGLMQLFQDYRMVSWGELPKGVNIVLSANPDGGDYIVTSLDPAKLSRIRSITFKPDVGAWSRWAEDHGVDHRGIKFLLRYPEMFVSGERTNPRTWVQSFETFRVLPEIDMGDAVNWKRFSMLLRSSIDDNAASTFSQFVAHGLGEIVDAEDVLENWDKVQEKVKKFIDERNIPALNVTTERLFNKISHKDFAPGVNLKKYVTNFQNYVMMPNFPQDMRFAVAQRIFQNKNNHHSMAFIKHDKIIDCLTAISS